LSHFLRFILELPYWQISVYWDRLANTAFTIAAFQADKTRHSQTLYGNIIINDEQSKDL